MLSIIILITTIYSDISGQDEPLFFITKKKYEKMEVIYDPKETVDDCYEKNNVDVSLNNSLYIGDSRTQGLMEYANDENIDYFCDIGMSVFNIYDRTVNIDGETVGLLELLNRHQYNKIYIMLGINELGYEFDSIVSTYDGLIDDIIALQENASIFLEANLHVTKARSKSDDTFNNVSIDRLNEKIKLIAIDKGAYYIDVNVLYDDAEGNLSADKSSDTTHLYAKYYTEWQEWIEEQTSILMKGECSF